MTRAFDILLASLALVGLAPVMLVVALLILLDSPGGALFRQRRVGWHGREFTIYKFRTMVRNAAKMGSSITAAKDPRVTNLGAFLRRSKLDELPQLINVIRGDMALVGPRPEVPEVVALYDGNMRRVLDLRPGITSLTSLDLADEEGLLADAADPDRFYLEVVLPAKVADCLKQAQPPTPLLTMHVLAATAVAAFRRLRGQASEGELMERLREHPALAGPNDPNRLELHHYSTEPEVNQPEAEITNAKEAA